MGLQKIWLKFQMVCNINIFPNLPAIRNTGCSKKNVIKSTVFLTDLKKHYQPFNNLYTKFFKENQAKPARSAIGVKELPFKALVEMEVILTTWKFNKKYIIS